MGIDKTYRQVKDKLSSGDNTTLRNQSETLFTVGLGLHLQKNLQTRLMTFSSHYHTESTENKDSNC